MIGRIRETKELNWLDAFLLLEKYLQKIDNGSRQLIFLDELPWLDSPRSGFLRAFEGWEQYLNKDTGTITAVPESKGIYDDPYEWEEIIVMIEEGEQFVRLPNQYEINEYRIMEEFADFAGDGLKYVSKEQASEIGQELYEALQGRGAFLRFKSTLNYYGIADEYYAYRHIYYIELAKEWCQDHEIEFVRG